MAEFEKTKEKKESGVLQWWYGNVKCMKDMRIFDKTVL